MFAADSNVVPSLYRVPGLVRAADQVAPGGGKLSIRWSPGHAGVPDNELADELAKEACVAPLSPGSLLTTARTCHMIRGLFDAAVRSYRGAEAPAQYREPQVEAGSRLFKELGLPRRELGRLLAARSRHGDFAE